VLKKVENCSFGALNSPKLLQTVKVARGCSKGEKLLKTPKVAHKLPSTIYKGLLPITITSLKLQTNNIPTKNIPTTTSIQTK
jgi:hypothetical protein